ncbi:calcium-binding protein [Pseudooctadecabacter sp.]|uniref:calcium-binding protein n=1 Tax=Pseudooctadecabacter sp. TaxID=1966338 RepID=UPI0035C842FA
MLALLGLIGVALAGTALIGLEQEDADADGPTHPDLHEETVEGDLLELLDEENTDVLTAGGPSHVEEFGTQDADTIGGAAGDDFIHGRDGDDTLIGEDGDDQLLGGEGDDTLTGGAGDDQLDGHIGNDIMSGGDGADRMQGGGGDDDLYGYDDDDDLLGGWGDDTLIGGAGQDNLQGSEGNDVVDGATGEDVAERDYLNGSEGNDHLIGNDGDVMTGGQDADTFEIVNGNIQIMDFSDEDVLVLNFSGDEPVLTTQDSAGGLVLLADGEPVANLVGVTDFDVSTVRLVSEDAAA